MIASWTPNALKTYIITCRIESRWTIKITHFTSISGRRPIGEFTNFLRHTHKKGQEPHLSKQWSIEATK